MLSTRGIIAASFIACAIAANTPEDATISSYVIWNDTSGNPVHAHGAGLWVDQQQNPPVYYMVGTSIKTGNAALSEYITLYKGTDLQHWDFVGNILRNTSISVPGVQGPWRIERPKIVQCTGTKKFVMYWHLDTASFGICQVGVATADSIEGPWTFSHSYQPDGRRSYDMGLYQDESDPSKPTYLVRSVENQFAGISKLTDDCMNTTGITSQGPRVEGQAIFRWQGHYYLLGSHLTGWAANPAVLAIADKTDTLEGANWTPLGNPSGSSDTFDSQSTFVLPYTHPSGRELLIYMGDRWNHDGPGGIENASYVWLPFEAPSSQSVALNFTFAQQWRIADHST